MLACKFKLDLRNLIVDWYNDFGEIANWLPGICRICAQVMLFIFPFHDGKFPGIWRICAHYLFSPFMIGVYGELNPRPIKVVESRIKTK